MFCTNCGTRLQDGANFCPNCGTQVKAVVQPVNQGNMVMLVSLGDCKRATAAALLQQICGYEADDALLIVDSAPITVARGLNDAQAKLLAQALAEYGMEVSVYDGDGWRDWESNTTSVWDNAGELVTGVAAALGLLGLIGGKMILESLNGSGESQEDVTLGVGTLLMQGVATSIDALSVGFAIADYSFDKALLASLIIAATTFAICLGGLALGKRVGTLLSDKASVLGGVILVAIGIEIAVRGV